MADETKAQAARYARLQRHLETAANTLSDILWNESPGSYRPDDSRIRLRDAMQEYAQYLANRGNT